MEGEREYTFWHMLVRDAAYAQIPRAARADKHAAVANWLEDRAGGRVEDLADVLAYHSFEALELTRASGGDVSGLEQQALRFLVLAGDRARNLDTAQAVVMYERALELAPEGDPVRGEILHEPRLRRVVPWSLRAVPRAPRGGDPLPAGCGQAGPSRRLQGVASPSS